MEMSNSADKRAVAEKRSVSFSSPHVFQGENKRRDEETEDFGCDLHPAVLCSPLIQISAFVPSFHLKTGFESDLFQRESMEKLWRFLELFWNESGIGL